MSHMMVWAINLFVLSIGIFVVGMIKPTWIFFWMKNPSRIQIQLLAGALFMGGAVMFGESNLAKQQEMAELKLERSEVIMETPSIITDVDK